METYTATQIDDIMKRYAQVKRKIALAMERSSRSSESVKLVVVTKRQPDELVLQIAKAGILLLGENYPEEGKRKRALLEQSGISAEWHLIGAVQRRKAMLAIENFSMIHSIDRLSIARALNQQAKQLGKQVQILLQFNVSGEMSKSGWLATDAACWKMLLPEIRQVCVMEHVVVKGLMTMPPFSINPETSRTYFRTLRKLQLFLTENIPFVSFEELSIGTSFDYEVAVEEGATFVRVGEAILGPRERNTA